MSKGVEMGKKIREKCRNCGKLMILDEDAYDGLHPDIPIKGTYCSSKCSSESVSKSLEAIRTGKIWLD